MHGPTRGKLQSICISLIALLILVLYLFVYTFDGVQIRPSISKLQASRSLQVSIQSPFYIAQRRFLPLSFRFGRAPRELINSFGSTLPIHCVQFQFSLRQTTYHIKANLITTNLLKFLFRRENVSKAKAECLCSHLGPLLACSFHGIRLLDVVGLGPRTAWACGSLVQPQCRLLRTSAGIAEGMTHTVEECRPHQSRVGLWS